MIKSERTFTVVCDGTGCTKSRVSKRLTGTQLRKLGKEEGWKYTKNQMDYCPECYARLQVTLKAAPSNKFNPSIPAKVPAGWGG